MVKRLYVKYQVGEGMALPKVRHSYRPATEEEIIAAATRVLGNHNALAQCLALIQPAEDLLIAIADAHPNASDAYRVLAEVYRKLDRDHRELLIKQMKKGREPSHAEQG